MMSSVRLVTILANAAADDHRDGKIEYVALGDKFTKSTHDWSFPGPDMPSYNRLHRVAIGKSQRPGYAPFAMVTLPAMKHRLPAMLDQENRSLWRVIADGRAAEWLAASQQSAQHTQRLAVADYQYVPVGVELRQPAFEPRRNSGVVLTSRRSHREQAALAVENLALLGGRYLA